MDRLLRLASEFPSVFHWLMAFYGCTVKLKESSASGVSENQTYGRKIRPRHPSPANVVPRTFLMLL
jgi:hypothetical protein